jgi:ankyrin repeat protein
MQDAAGAVKLMMKALNERNLELTKELLDAGFLVDQSLRPGENYTALHFAATCSFEDGCALLIERGANVNALCSLGVGALHLSASRNCAGACAALLAAGADVQVLSHKDETALHWAALAGATDACRVLVHAGSDPDAEDRVGQTPLHLASNPDTFAYLLSAGADPEHMPPMTTKDYLSPFQHAVQRVWVEQVKLCLARGGIDLEQRTLDGRTLTDLTGRRVAVRDILRKAREALATGLPG